MQWILTQTHTVTLCSPFPTSAILLEIFLLLCEELLLYIFLKKKKDKFFQFLRKKSYLTSIKKHVWQVWNSQLTFALNHL